MCLQHRPRALQFGGNWPRLRSGPGLSHSPAPPPILGATLGATTAWRRPRQGGTMIRFAIAILLAISFAGTGWAQPKAAPAAKPEGEMRWALYVTLAPAWF